MNVVMFLGIHHLKELRQISRILKSEVFPTSLSSSYVVGVNPFLP